VSISFNVVHKTGGHGIYITSQSSNNTIDSNLVSETYSLASSDMIAGGADNFANAFQNLHMPNDYSNNVAVGGRRNGFRMVGVQHILNEDGSVNKELGDGRKLPIGTFSFNAAKSMGSTGFGLYNFRAPEKSQIFLNLKAIKNREKGFLLNNGRHVSLSGLFAENGVGIDMPWTDDVRIMDSRIVGYSDLTKSLVAYPYYQKRCSGYNSPPIGFRMQTQIYELDTFEAKGPEHNNKGSMLKNVVFSDFDHDDALCGPKSMPISFNRINRRNNHMDATSSFENVVVEGNKFTDSTQAFEDGLTDIVITDVGGTSDPLNLSQRDSAFVSKTSTMTKFVDNAKCSAAYDELYYCTDTCLRTVSFMVDQTETEDWTMYVTNQDGVQNYVGHYYPFDGEDKAYNKLKLTNSRGFAVALPLGSYEVSFRDSASGEPRWPRFVKEFWEGEPACDGHANGPNVTVVEPEEFSCDELFLNGGFEDGTKFWQYEDTAVMTLLPIGGLDGSAALFYGERTNHYQGIGQNLDTRCFHANLGKYYEISGRFKLEKDGSGITCDPNAAHNSASSSINCPFVNVIYYNYDDETKEDSLKSEVNLAAKTLAPFKLNEFNYFHGVFRINEGLHTANQVKAVFERFNAKNDAILDDFSVTPLDTTAVCDTNLVRNGDFASGNSMFFSERNGGKLDVQPEGDGYALKVFDRKSTRSGFKQSFHLDCLVVGSRYAITANYKIDDGKSCDLFKTGNECVYLLVAAKVNDNDSVSTKTSTVAVASGANDGWSRISNTISIKETHVADKHEYFTIYFEGPKINYDLTFKDIALTPLKKNCQQLILNGEFEDATTSFWYPAKNLKGYFEVITPGASTSGSGNSQYALYFNDDDGNGKTQGNRMRQNLDPVCLVPEVEYTIRAKFKYVDPADKTSGIECDPTVKNQGKDNHCPSVVIQGLNCGESNVFLRLWNTIPFFEWKKDIYNDFKGTFLVSGNLATCDNVYVELGNNLKSDRALLIDDVEIELVGTESPTSPPTEFPTQAPKPPEPTGKPTIATDAPTIGSNISCPSVDSEPLEINPGHLLVFNAPANALCTLTKAVFSSTGEVEKIMPIARSYDQNQWEVAPGTFASSVFLNNDIWCYDNGCQMDLTPSISKRQQSIMPQAFSMMSRSESKYYLTSYEHSLSQRNEYARFLESATFGITSSELDVLEGSGAASPIAHWIKDQIDNVPMSSHREYWRQGANPRALGPQLAGIADHPCDAMGRWRRFTFTIDDCDQDDDTKAYKLLRITSSGSNYILRLDGVDRTVVPKSDFYVKNIGYESYVFDESKDYEVCSIGATSYRKLEFVGGDLQIRLKDKTPCLSVPNPPVNFDGHKDLVEYILSLNNTSSNLLENIDESWQSGGAGYIILNELDDTKCSSIPLNALVYGRLQDKSWLQFDSRLTTMTNNLADPIDDGGKSTEIVSEGKTFCSNVARTYQNEDQCVLTTNACSSSSANTEVEFTLDDDNIRQLFDLTNQYIYGMKGLAVVDKDDERIEHPCTPGLRSRWELIDMDLCEPTNLFQGTYTNLTWVLSDSTDTNPYLRDVYFPDSDDFFCDEEDTDPEIEIVVDGDCWRRVHHDHMSVYDLTYWTQEGRHFGGSENIKKWAEQNKAFLIFPSKHPSNKLSNHPMSRWDNNKNKFTFIGRYGDEIKVRDLPINLKTQEVINHFSDDVGDNKSSIFVCGSPGEVGNDKKLGFRFDVFNNEQYMSGRWHKGFGRNYVWLMIVLSTVDQLRQRVAYALSQIIVVVPVQINNQGGHSEWFLNYYDIFVRHAFGNYRDILKDISYSPLMAENLSFLQSKSTAYVWERYRIRAYADENFAREIMQLFTIGIVLLNMDGTPKLDANGNEILAYTNDAIMSFSRAWTGFDVQFKRGNIEGPERNQLDPMRIDGAWRDKFPKIDLQNGYIGDRYPLCEDFPSRGFLKKGAIFRLLGSSNLPELMTDPPQFATEPAIKKMVLDNDSFLKKILCNADTNGDCQYENSVTLTSNLKCSSRECDVDTVRVVQVAEKIFFEYVHPPCVKQSFYNNAKKLFPSSSSGKAVCGNPLLSVGSEACCDANSYTAVRNYIYDGERMPYQMAEDRCRDISKTTCDFTSVTEGDSFTKMGYFWTTDPCQLRVKIDSEGLVAIVHEPSFYTQKVPHVDEDSENYFKVNWDSNNYPRASNDCDGMCIVLYDSCICNTAVASSRVFKKAPTRKAEVLSSLYIGAVDPSIYEEGVFSSTFDAETGITTHTKGGKFDSDTVFELNDDTGRSFFLKNMHETVNVMSMRNSYTGYSFRNVPQFMSLIPSETTVLDAQYETEAVLDNYFYHGNTPPFISIRLLQRFGMSNPSPRYVKAVATAFKYGVYDADGVSFGTGKYGDLAATTAAILLDRESRNIALDADPSHGSLREPLLKYVGLMRSLEFVSELPVIAIPGTKNNIHQMPHEYPNVFSFFLPEFQPYGRVGDAGLVAPEAQLLDMPKIVGWLNGMFSLVKNGLYSTDGGFGFWSVNSGLKTGILEYNKTATSFYSPFETFEGRSLTGGLDNEWIGPNFQSHFGHVVDDPDPSGDSNHVLTFEKEYEYNGFIYLVRRNKLTSEDHEVAAVAWGGHLASVHSNKEHLYLQKIIGKSKSMFIIGGTRTENSVGTDGSLVSWKWTDKTPWDFTNWHSTEPNDVTHNTLVMNGNRHFSWADIRDRATSYAIYKKVNMYFFPLNMFGL